MKSVKKIIAITLVSAFLFVTGSALFAAEQTTCPVMGGKITYRLFSDFNGKRVFFCCFGCKPIFEKDPERYLEKLKEIGQEPMDISNMSN